MKQKLYFFLSLMMLCIFGSSPTWAATETIFSAVPTSETYSVPASTSDTEISSTYATVSGGTMYVTNDQTSVKDLIKSSKFVFTNNNTFFKVVLSNALEAGDVITVNYQGGVKNSDNKGIWISTATSRPNEAPAAVMTSSTESYQDGTYTVTATDEYVGKTTFYTYRSAGATTYMASITITRQVDSAPVFSTNLPATASVGVGSSKTFTVASDATSYQWYKASSSIADPDNDTQLEGTGASYEYTAPDSETTEYIYCIATNANGSTTSTVCAVTVEEFTTVTFGLTRPLTVDESDATKGTMGDNEWDTANGAFTLTEVNGTGVSIDKQERTYVINNVSYTSTTNYRKDTKLSDFDETQFAGYSFVIPDGKKLDITQVDARLSDASNCTWTWKIEVQDADGNSLWNTGKKTTSSNSTTTVSISDNAIATALEGLVSGTYYAKIYFYQNGSSKCNTIDLTFTGKIKDADAAAPTVTIASEQTMIKDAENTITSVVQAYPEATDFQWYSCEDANGTNPTAVEGQTTSTLTVTPTTAGMLYYYLAATNTVGTTNSNVCTVTVVAEAEFSDFSAILNNGTGTLITSDEISSKSAVSFGISVDNEGNVVRVDADSPLAFATVSGTYHSEHGLQGFKTVVKVPGNVKIKLGTCAWGGNVTIKNAEGETVATTNTNNGTCYHGNTSSNKVTVYYEGDATTLTIEGGNYVPFISIESVSTLYKYAVNFVNGEETVATKTVYNDGIESQAIGTLPTAPAVEGKQFIGWYTATDGTGDFAMTSTVPTADITYYANYVNLNVENGYVVVDNSGTDRRNGENLLGALAYANANASANNPVKIFLKNGTYDLGDDAETTQITGSYVSLIGESLDGTIITNVPTQEGLGTATLLYNKGQYNYLQDLTLWNNYPYGNSTGRAASLKDEGNYTICNNVWLYSHQDTYYSHSSGAFFYFKGGKISGCVDYMCGQSRVYYDGVTLSNDNRGTTMTANSELYVFNNCVIENGGSDYNFGRAWSSVNNGPVCVFLNTTLKDNGSKLASTRWNPDGLNVDYAIAGEYGTMNASGTGITPPSNSVTFKKNNTILETILTADQAATYTMEYTLGDWAATAASDVVQATVSSVTLSGSTLAWESDAEAFLIEKDGAFVALTADKSYDVSNFGTGLYTVRAANSRGGFGEATQVAGAGTLTWNIATGTSATSLTSTQVSTIDGITTDDMTAIQADAADTAGKINLTVKLNCGTAETAAATVTFTVPDGYAFIPYSTTAKVQPISKDAYVKVALGDVASEAASFTQGQITEATLTEDGTRELTGTVTVGIYCYDGAQTGVTTYRLSTPVTVTGQLVELAAQTVTATVSSAGWATLYTDKALDFSQVEGLTAYTATVSENTVTLTKVTEIGSAAGVVLQGKAGTYDIPVLATEPNTAKGSLTGDATDATAWNKYANNQQTIYILAPVNDGKDVQFVPCTSGSIAAKKAFLVLDTPANTAKAMQVVFASEATGISNVNASVPVPVKRIQNGQLVIEKNGKTYNAAGQLK